MSLRAQGIQLHQEVKYGLRVPHTVYTSSVAACFCFQYYSFIIHLVFHDSGITLLVVQLCLQLSSSFLFRGTKALPWLRIPVPHYPTLQVLAWKRTVVKTQILNFQSQDLTINAVSWLFMYNTLLCTLDTQSKLFSCILITEEPGMWWKN